MPLSHLNGKGEASMVDVSPKAETERIARASGTITMNREAYRAIKDADLKKGDALAVARVAGIMAGKQTSSLIPLCHNIPLDKIGIDFVFDDERCMIHVTSSTKTSAKTGVEMEAITALSIALVTIYDMAKALDRGMTIGDIRLLEKDGGKSGHYEAPDA